MKKKHALAITSIAITLLIAVTVYLTITDKNNNREQSMMITELRDHVEGLEYKACSKQSEFAEALMRKRQNNFPMEELINRTRDTSTLSAEGKEEMIDMITIVYDTPLYSSPEIQERIIKKYQNEIYNKCVKAIRQKQ